MHWCFVLAAGSRFRVSWVHFFHVNLPVYLQAFSVGSHVCQVPTGSTVNLSEKRKACLIHEANGSQFRWEVSVLLCVYMQSVARRCGG